MHCHYDGNARLESWGDNNISHRYQMWCNNSDCKSAVIIGSDPSEVFKKWKLQIIESLTELMLDYAAEIVE